MNGSSRNRGLNNNAHEFYAEGQLLQDQQQSNSDNLNNIRREVSRYFSNKTGKIFKVKLINLKVTLRHQRIA
jgi:hypothetical protein